MFDLPPAIMGSLMAGWDSPVSDPKTERMRRNSSLTKDEIHAFWRSKKEKEEEHLRDISLVSPRGQLLEHALKEDAAEIKYQRSSSLPSLPERNKFLNVLGAESAAAAAAEEDDQPSMEKLIQKNGWWVSSNWAFLNEPPVIDREGPQHKYAAQFHVANMGSTTNNAQTGVGA